MYFPPPFLYITVLMLLTTSCSDSKKVTNDNAIEKLPYSQYDRDYDGLADKYESAFNLVVGKKDADKIFLDPLLAYQWYLQNDRNSKRDTCLKIGVDINVSPVWRFTLGSKDVVVSVVDTGIDSAHEDIAIDRNKSYRYSDSTHDPSPTIAQLYEDNSGSAHGTACAGIIGAKGWNARGIRGIAPNITLVGLNVFSKPEDSSFSDALQREGIDVSSNSWGAGGAHWLFDDRISLEAIENGVKNGRQGKGTTYIFAAGNDSANSNFQSILTSTYVIAVSAVDSDGKLENYSDFGSNILVTAPGGANDMTLSPAIATTDLIGLENGMDRYDHHWDVALNSDGNYTNLMNGTSAACPMVSGVVALMLSVNKNLTYRDIQYILATTATQNDANDLFWKKNAKGYSISDKYGFGMLNAGAAVKRAISFKSLGHEYKVEKSYDTNVKIDTFNEIVLEADIEESFYVTNVQLQLNTNHTNNGKLKITLESPSGTQSLVAYGDTVLYNKYEPWTFLSVQFLDEKSEGKWLLHIQDMGSEKSGALKEWSLIIRGYTK